MCSIRASILHADLDAFFASVEQRDRPDLLGRAMAVGSGVILAASYEARSLGVRTAMPIQTARRLCPHLITVAPRMDAYTEASRAVLDIFRDTTPLVEPISIDEAFLDVSGLGRLVGTPEWIAQRLRVRVASEVGLPISVGVARTKFLAKVASAVSKPDGLLVIEPADELAFLHPLPIARLWGIGPATAAKLEPHGIRTVGDIAALDEATLISIVGIGTGRHLQALANNRDSRSVVTGRRRSSIGSQRALGRRQRSFDDHEATLLELIDRVTRRLRDGHRVGRTLTLRFRFGDFERDTRSHTLPQPTGSTADFLDAGRVLLAARRSEIERRRLTLLGVTIANLSPSDQVQQTLPFGDRSNASLDAALDAVRHRYGTSAIGRATLLKRTPGMTVPMLADPVPNRHAEPRPDDA